MFDFFKILCYSVVATTINKLYYIVIHPLYCVVAAMGVLLFYYRSHDTMETKILDAVCILPRIELLNRYLEEEIDQLEEYLRSRKADEHVEKICDRIRMLAWMQEDISSKAFKDVNTILGGI